MGHPTEEELEDVEGKNALLWVRAQNAVTAQRFESSPGFDKTQQDVLKILENKEKIPYVRKVDEFYYNFWRDENHVRGVWRWTNLHQYRKSNPKWYTIIDFDELAEKEQENWVYAGANRLMPDGNRVLVAMSKGGTDANVKREFDIRAGEFVKDGFYIPEAKSRVAWLDIDHLLVASDFGPDSLTDSGYPRVLKLHTRGEALEKAPVIFEAQKTDVSVYVHTQVRPEGSYTFVTRSPSFFEQEVFLLNFDDEYQPTLTKIPVPLSSELEDIINHQALIKLKEDWQHDGQTFSKGSLVSLDLKSLNDETPKVHTVFEPKQNMAIESVTATKSYIFVNVNHNVTTEIYQLRPTEEGYEQKKVPIPENGTASIISADDFSDDLMINYENFLTPSTLFVYRNWDDKMYPIKQAPSHFDASNLEVEQRKVESKDGTLVPYFIIHPKDMPLDGSNPTLLYGYGGFEVSLTPSYSGALGKTWLEEGNVYVLANIRGGGEYGPEWHQAALKENRQNAYDDFAAIAQDLIAQGITSPKHLGIQGGSNGGLLMGVAFTQHPELYNAVVCQVPLLDMLKYHKLSAGASWMGEYGDPDNPEEKAYIEKYSPYQNVQAGVEYPEVFFMTSTKDDRVHPSHARKMVAKMQDQGHQVFYFETIEGGHGAAANLKQSAYNKALTTTYLKDKLCTPKVELIEDEETHLEQSPPAIRFGKVNNENEECESANEQRNKLKKSYG